MKKSIFLKATAAVGLVLVASSCVDDKYDLSDIDTTTEIKLNELTLPIKIEDVTFGDIINLGENSKLKVIDGKYVFMDEGSFHSDAIEVKQIKINGPRLEPSYDPIHVGGTATGTVTYDVESRETDFSYNDGNVDHSIKAIDAINTELKVQIDVYVSELASASQAFTFKNLEVQLPKDLVMTTDHGTYNSTTGILSIPSVLAKGSKITVVGNVTAIKIGNEAKFTYSETGKSSFTFTGAMKLLSGALEINSEYFGSKEPSDLTLVTKFTLGTLTVKEFTGKIDYQLEGFKIDPVYISNIPEFLNQPGTSISLYNPQICLNMTNPVYNYNLEPQASMTLTPVRGTEEGSPAVLPAPFDIAAVAASSYYLAPHTTDVHPSDFAGFSNPTYVAFPALSDVLKGDGLPDRLNVTIDDAGIYNQHVNNFVLTDPATHRPVIGAVDGKYMFYAPVEFNANSKIVYSTDSKDWSDDDLDNLIIDTLTVTATVYNSTGFDIECGGWPLGKDGKQIGNVHFEGARIAAGETREITISTVGGKIEKLDGVHITVELLAPARTAVLSPDEFVNLKDIRATISGNFTKEL